MEESTKDMIEHLEKIESEAKELREKIEEKESRKTVTLVPKSIKIIHTPDVGDGLGIAFNEGKQFLFHGKEYYEVWGVNSRNPIQCKLIPCKKDDLNVGDTAFCCGYTPNFADLGGYCKILELGKFAYIDGNEAVHVTSCEVEHWWKVVKETEK
ncbi:MAG: hypothetical protein GY861_17070 [bacterium]|nr:hypothetical protein [bacterium]